MSDYRCALSVLGAGSYGTALAQSTASKGLPVMLWARNEEKAQQMAERYNCPFVDNEMPYGRVPQGHPIIVDYFYHEEIRGSENTGVRKR